MRMYTPLCILAVSLTTALAKDYHLEYFKDVTLLCDNDMLNLTTSASSTQPEKKYWILPNGDVMDENDDSDSHMLIMLPNFNLTITKIDDSDFGVYYCVLVWSNHSITLIRNGLNVDGADYGDLLEQYRHNAMIGGIAAAVLFVIVAGSCLIWHFRFSGRGRSDDQDDLDKAKLHQGHMNSRNGGFDNLGVEVEMETKDDKTDHAVIPYEQNEKL